MRLKHLLLSALLLHLCVLSSTLYAEVDLPKVGRSDIVILYDNDVHCAIDGYAKMAYLRTLFRQQTDNVLVVSNGDFVTGTPLGSYSKGDYILRVMNVVGYDYVTLGNHEFDYCVPRIFHIDSMLHAEILCCNFMSEAKRAPVFQRYKLLTLGGRTIALVGVTTPETPSATSPIYFKDILGRQEYSFASRSFFSTVQNAVSEVRSKGAGHVILLSHVGDKGTVPTSLELIRKTYGVDVVLDGHAHNVIEGRTVKNRVGKGVLLTSTGYSFANIGCLVIDSNGTCTSHLIPMEKIEGIDSAVADTIAAIKLNYGGIGQQQLGYSNANLPLVDSTDEYLPRLGESALGTFCAEAFMAVTQADMAILNGGSYRDSITSGQLIYDDIFKLFPFGNNVVVVEVTGQDIIDLLEVASATIPKPSGRFAQVAGLRYTINAATRPSIRYDRDNIFVKVLGRRRVSDVEVLNQSTGNFEPIEPQQTYRLATTDYVFSLMGCGYRFRNAKVIEQLNVTDAGLVIGFIENYRHGVIPEKFEKMDGRISIVK